ncbi:MULTISPECIES: hypothetical protein [Rhodomicrobium]|uniref:hypothetical protein n=1 Tax=Rhodomicrobium TaxID=1068 RepID=UPI000B4AB785|nr:MULTISPECIES: hypothetical protein [Rhodomicrobium]
MIKTAFAVAIIAVAASTCAHAASTDCISKYDDFWEKMRQYGNAKPSAEAVVEANRRGLRAFDACQAGDETNFSQFWDNMKRYGNNKQDDANQFWKDILEGKK